RAVDIGVCGCIDNGGPGTLGDDSGDCVCVGEIERALVGCYYLKILRCGERKEFCTNLATRAKKQDAHLLWARDRKAVTLAARGGPAARRVQELMCQGRFSELWPFISNSSPSVQGTDVGQESHKARDLGAHEAQERGAKGSSICLRLLTAEAG